MVEGIGLLDEDEKGGLEGVVNVVRVAKIGAADAENHRAVAGDDRLEGGVVAIANESIEELTLGQPRDAARSKESVDLAIDACELPGRHVTWSPSWS
jgi:hypothetical protein